MENKTRKVEFTRGRNQEGRESSVKMLRLKNFFLYIHPPRKGELIIVKFLFLEFARRKSSIFKAENLAKLDKIKFYNGKPIIFIALNMLNLAK